MNPKAQRTGLTVTIALFLCAAPAFASDWTVRDTAVEAAVVGALVIDWRQTLEIAANSRFHECNPILGRKPSTSRVNQYFLAAALLHVGVAYVLPPKWRHGFQYVTLGVELGCITNNYRIGVRIPF